MEIGYYWIQIKGEAPEIAFYSKKTNMFFRIGTGIGVMCKGLIILEKVKSEGQKKQESSKALHKHGVKASLPYGFLYWLENDSSSHLGRHKWIKANDIDQACKEFIRRKPKTLRQVDYEVLLGGDYIDISHRNEFKNWL